MVKINVNKIKIILISLCVISIFSSCSSKESKIEDGKEALDRLGQSLTADNIYIGFSEQHYVNNNLAAIVEIGAARRGAQETMIYNDYLEDYTYNTSVLNIVGNKVEKSGDFDFYKTYGEEPVDLFIEDVLISIDDVVRSGNFNIIEKENGFTAICNNELYIQEFADDFLNLEMHDGNSFKSLIGNDIEYSLEIDFDINEFGGINIKAKNKYSGDTGTISIDKETQIMLDYEYIEEAQNVMIKELKDEVE